MYTTNAIEAVNSSFRKVTKRGAFPNDNSVFKLLYLRVVELQKKWSSRPVANWSLVRNQLLLNDRLSALFDKFDRNFSYLHNLLDTTLCPLLNWGLIYGELSIIFEGRLLF